MARGRPIDPEQQEKMRMALLDVMRELLSKKTYKSISIREVAELAGTYSAMISYYFENKEGLVKALVLRTAAERKIVLASIAQEVVSAEKEHIPILVNRVLTTLLKEPWLFRLLQDDLMMNNEAFRQFFLDNFVLVVVTGLQNLFTLLQQNQIIRPDVNIKFMVPTFMSLISFPIMSQPVLKDALGIDTETLRSPEWQDHISQFLTSHLTPNL
jgi:AcrR family transcriptional regulator